MQVQHGNFQTSADWTLENESLAYYLSKHGYDVILLKQAIVTKTFSTHLLRVNAYKIFFIDETGMVE